MESWGRATWIVGKNLGLGAEETVVMLIYKFQYDNSAWNRIRDTIKKVSGHHMLAEKPVMSPHESLIYLTSVGPMLKDDIYLPKKAR